MLIGTVRHSLIITYAEIPPVVAAGDPVRKEKTPSPSPDRGASQSKETEIQKTLQAIATK